MALLAERRLSGRIIGGRNRDGNGTNPVFVRTHARILHSAVSLFHPQEIIRVTHCANRVIPPFLSTHKMMMLLQNALPRAVKEVR